MALDSRQFARLRTLTEGSRKLTNAASLDEVLAVTVNRAAMLLDAKRSLLALLDPEGFFEIRISFGMEADVQLRESLDGHLLERLQALLGLPRFLAVPLVISGHVRGFLAVGCEPSEEHEEYQEWLLSALADQAAIALEKSSVNEHAAFRERLIGIVGHDLRNPLGAIHMASELLLLSERLEPREMSLARRIANSSRRMTEIVNLLLDFTNLRLGGGIPLSCARTNLGKVCFEVVDELRMAHPSASLRYVECVKEVEGSWDSARLAQVISNLVANALQHGKQNGPIEVRLDATGTTVTVSVWNEGPPIPESARKTLFDPFKKGNVASATTLQNLGLGLYIAQAIAEAHHGCISVHSSEEGGTTFSLELPLMKSRAKESR